MKYLKPELNAPWNDNISTANSTVPAPTKAHSRLRVAQRLAALRCRMPATRSGMALRIARAGQMAGKGPQESFVLSHQETRQGRTVLGG
jgi:hypothetical protein